MEKDPEGKMQLKRVRGGWSEGRRKYACADRVHIKIVGGASKRWRQDTGFRNRGQTVPANAVTYCVNTSPKALLFVTKTEFDRSMSWVVGLATDAKTFIFPSTVRESSGQEDQHMSVQSAILNERLEIIGPRMFCDTKIKRIVIPKTTSKIDFRAFQNCENLKQVVFEEGSKLEEIGLCCFQDSGLDEIILPKTLKYIGQWAFQNCGNPSTIYVEDGCEADLLGIEIECFVHVGPLRETMTGEEYVWDLREQKNVVIPEGTERIGNSWFYRSGIESVEIPASVKQIDANAFCYCQNLKHVKFAEGSQLEKIGASCFSNSGIKEIQLPRTLKEIGEDVFKYCKNLNTVWVEAGCTLDVRKCVDQSVDVRQK